MDLTVLGLNHQTAPLSIREQVDFSKFPTEQYLLSLAERKSVRSGVVVSTCNRVEIYAGGADLDELTQDAWEFLSKYHKVKDEDLRKFFYRKDNRDAVRHLFRVASSLDSLVVGEPQILGQMKEAYFASSSQELIDPFFDRLFQKAFAVAKRIRSETEISKNAVSVSYAAVELAKKIFGGLQNNSAFILGAGEMAELIARHLHRQKIRQVTYCNRSFRHSVELVEQYGGIPVPFDQLERFMGKSDIVLVSTGAPHYLVKPEQVEKLLDQRVQAPMFFIDISVPRNVDPAIHEMNNVYLYNIDDLQSVVNTNQQVRGQEADKAEAIIEAEVEKFYMAINKLKSVPTIQDLQNKYQGLKASEIERLLSKLKDLKSEEKKEVEKAMESLVRKVMNHPILYMRKDDPTKTMEERSDLVRKIFGLDVEDD